MRAIGLMKRGLSSARVLILDKSSFFFATFATFDAVVVVFLFRVLPAGWPGELRAASGG